ncbi:MAG: Ig-like domain-containing protein, partial [Nitrospirae bacterium]|nr:Ig-like domain-containing protein [Nitrospirota bacterium]
MNLSILRGGLSQLVKMSGITLAMGLWVLLPVAASHAATLSSIAVSPANPTIELGQIQPFVATGTFSDGTTRSLIHATLSSGTEHTCVILLDGTVECWGSNGTGQLGDGTTTDSAVPVPVSGISTAIAISAGWLHTCALLSNGSVNCWGNNGTGQLGDGTTTDSAVPVPVSGMSTAIAISVGGGYSCALLSAGTVKCWGDNTYGQLGNGSAMNSPVPLIVSGISTASQISTGSGHACVLLAGGTLQCWGDNTFGQLGNGSTSNSSVPLDVTGINTATGIASGGTASTGSGHTCALLSGGAVKCWGYNGYGQLGNGSKTNSSIPVSVSAINTATEVSTGGDHSCALLSDGHVQCWGNNGVGQLGEGSYINSSAPVQVSGINSARGISSRGDTACAILLDATVQCWGYNGSGQLGDGTTNDSNVPVSTSGSLSALAVFWNSDNVLVSWIDANGLATGSSVGTSKMTVTTSGAISGNTNLSVTAPSLTSISVIPLIPSIVIGQTQQFTAVGNYSNGSTQNLTESVTWSSSKPAFSIISNTSGTNGLATAVSLGTSTITASIGSVSSSTTLAVITAAQPMVTSLSPATSIYGVTASRPLTIAGSNFLPGATIKLGTLTGTAQYTTTAASSATPFVYLSSTRLSLYWENISLSPGAYDLTVTNPVTGGGLSNSATATFTVVAPQPTLSGISPATVTYGVTLSTALSILGTNFVPGATISVGTLTGVAVYSTTPATAATPFVYLSSSRLSVYWNNTSLSPGSYDVTVTNPLAGGGLSVFKAAAFTVVAPQPALSGMSPSSVTYGVTLSGDVTITGSNFAPGATISIGTLTGKTVPSNVPATSDNPFVYLSSTSLSVYWPNNSLSPGSYDVTVTNPLSGGGLSVFKAAAFTVIAPQPALSGITPSGVTYGVTLSGDVTISGSNFAPGATISIGTLSGTSVQSTGAATATRPFVYLSSNRLSVYWSNTSLSPDSYTVTVTNPVAGGGLAANLATPFTVVAPQPSLSGVSPASVTYGVTLSGDVTITGTNFAPGATISVGTLTGTAVPSTAPATSVNPFVYLSSTRLSVYWSNTSLSAGTYDVMVTNPLSGGGQSASLPA